MLKIEYRKLAMVVVALAAVGMMAACSGSSSTDDPLTPPGEDYLGSLRFDVDTTAGTVNVTPVGSPWGPQIVGDGFGGFTIPVAITTNPTSIVQGGGALNFDVKIAWSDANSELNNVRIGINAANPAGIGVTLANSDKCDGTIAACVPPNDSAIAYVSDAGVTEGGTGFTACVPCAAPPCLECNVMVDSTIPPGCGSITRNWQMTGVTGDFTFWANLYGEQMASSMPNDPRYDEGAATFYLRTFAVNGQVQGPETSVVSAGQWFYVHTYLDNPGNFRSLPYSWNPAVGIPHMEDTGNIAAWANGSSSSANYWYMGQVWWTVRFDPAVIELNSSFPIGQDPPGNASYLFTTAGGTSLKMTNDFNDALDGVNFELTGLRANVTASNMMGLFRHYNAGWTAAYYGIFPNPCGRYDVDPHACGPADGFAGIDWDVAAVPLRAKVGSNGKSSYLHPSFDTNQGLVAYMTAGKPYSLPDHWGNVPAVSPNYPLRPNEVSPRAGAFRGYNAERRYICVNP